MRKVFSAIARFFLPKRAQLATVHTQIRTTIAEADRRVDAMLARLNAHEPPQKG